MQEAADNLFPSPVGELHFSMLAVNGTINHIDKFPSPVGELHFSKGQVFSIDWEKLVSVPCRGTTFLKVEAEQQRTVQFVSVPCRGTTFLNEIGISHV